jgi:hypothetical protein
MKNREENQSQPGSLNNATKTHLGGCSKAQKKENNIRMKVL